MNSIVECVPNFSEGRRPEIVDAIIAALTSVPDIYLLDREMDKDHNRCVITIVGPKESIGEAAVRGTAKAMELIDLTLHKGEHPRMGATDVVPFIPIKNVSMEECVKIAEWVGQEIWNRLKVPVYLYESAARRPERVNLENIRKGQFEGIREEIKTNSDRLPDFGQASVHPTAGATVVGARKFLVAMNANLSTSDVGIAKKIAKAVRFSSGGLRYVKAMGVMLQARNVAQVSMNLTDFEGTPMHRAYEMVKSEAARYGCSIIGTEIVGLVPQKALDQAIEFFLRVENFSTNMVLENRLADAIAKSAPACLSEECMTFLDKLASPSPTPGGGCASGLAIAMAAGLGLMVVGLTRGKKKYAEFEAELGNAQEALAVCSRFAKGGIDRDASAFDDVMKAMALPKETDSDKAARAGALEAATITAADVPLAVAQNGLEVLKELRSLEGKSNANCASDLKVANLLCKAGIEGALANVEINLGGISDKSKVKSLNASIEEIRRSL
jgi:glutamate formiminotransferase / formiminotetrahydrofolate cyclodeaminase